QANDFHRVLTAGAETLVSDGSTGSVMRLRGDEFVVTEAAETWQVDRALISSVNLPEAGQAILGTNGSGALAFDGQHFTPLATDGLLSARQRINDLCATAGGYYCAALDSFGLVFFDSRGRVVQVLDRSVDHRLA